MIDLRSRRLPAPTDDRDRKLLADVEGHGWHVLGVQSEDDGPDFAYSVGLYQRFNHPELIVFGLDVDVMHTMINSVGELARAGHLFADFDESDDVLEKYNVMFRVVERRHYREHFGYALWFYHPFPFPVLQCVWPDSQHRYPWHPSFNPNLVCRQPVLADDVSWFFQAGKNRAVFTTKSVTEDGYPVLQVFHDKQDDWQFLSGLGQKPGTWQLVSLGNMIERDPTLAELADLPEGWCASRRSVGAKWRREPIEGE
jgi:hypothetical protein